MNAVRVSDTEIKVTLGKSDTVSGETDIWYCVLDNLPKYTFECDPENPRADGNAINYTVSEGRFLKNNNGIYEPWESHITEYSIEQEKTVVTTPVPNNHTGDIYAYTFISRVIGTADLVINKYWMDANGSSTSGIRPDIKTTVYRSYTKTDDNNIPYTTVEKVGQLETDWISKNVEDDGWWEISYGSLEKYTSDGYVINYYVQENITTESTQYQNTETFLGEPSVSEKSYVNYNDKQYAVHTSPEGRYIEIGGTKYATINNGSREYVVVNGTELTVYTVNEAVIDDYDSLKGQFYTIQLGSAQNVLVQNGEESVYIPTNIAYKSVLETNDIKVAPFIYDRNTGDYAKGTIVNKPVSDRDISGRKIWENLPLSGGYPSDEMPDVLLTLYRYSYDEMEYLREQGMLNSEGYPKTVDSEHIVRLNNITKDRNNEEYISGESDFYTVTLNGIPEVSEKKARAVTASLENYESFDFDENKFNRYDDRGKPYTYVLFEGYITTVEVWRYKEGEDREKAKRIYTQKLSGVSEHTDITIGSGAFPTSDENGTAYHYFINQVDGTESLDESYTFAYKMVQNEEHGIVITNLYHDDQNLTVDFTKKWKGLPAKLAEEEMPTATFRLVRYIQGSSGANQGQKITSTKEVIDFKESSFGFQRYVTIGEERIYLQHRQYVTYKDERHYIVKEGTHLVFDDFTKVYADEEDLTVKYIIIGGEKFYLEPDEQSVIVGNEVYSIENENGSQYAVIPVKESNQGKYVTIGYSNVYVFEEPSTYYVKIGENYYNVESDSEGDYIAYTEIINGNVVIGENTYEIKTESGKSYIEAGSHKYYLDEENEYVRIDVLSTSQTAYQLTGKTTDTDGSTRYNTVQVTYTGSAVSEFEVEWTGLAYYAPNMKPYIYEIEEIGVTNGFGVRVMNDTQDTDYVNTSVQSVTEENGSTRQSYTENGIEKSDYATAVYLSADKKDRTALNTGMENVYGEKTGYIKVQKEWKNDTGYEVSARPTTLDVNLYRTLESSIPENRNDSTASSKYYSSDIYVERGADNQTAVGYTDTFYTAKMPENQLISVFDQSYSIPSDKAFELSGNVSSSSWEILRINNLQIYSPNGRKYYYYVTEKVPDGYTQETACIPVNAVEYTVAESDTVPAKILNTLVPTTAKASKIWKYDDTAESNWSNEEMLFASNLSGIAKSITYRLVYATRDLDISGNPTGEWSDWNWLKNAGNGYVEKTAYMSENGAFPDVVWTEETDKLPNYIRVGGVLKAVRYMPVEYSLKYAKGDEYTRTDLNSLNASENKISDTFSMGFVSGVSEWTDTNTSNTANTVERHKITIRKDWGDEYNRDKLRDTAVCFDITRNKINTSDDSQTVQVELTRENEVSGKPNVWEKSFYVPVFVNYSNSVYSQYTVTEVLSQTTSTLYGYQTAVTETDSGNPPNYTSGKTADAGIMETDKTVYFNNSKSRTELTVTPSKLWYMVEAEQYPKENDNGESIEIPDWLKKIIFPDGDTEKLKIRFKLQYQIADGFAQENYVPPESNWKDISQAQNDEDFENAGEDLAGIAPYLGFSVDKYGNISKVGTADKWEHLPRHYLTNDVDTFATYFYRIQEIIIKDGEQYTAENETTFL